MNKAIKWLWEPDEVRQVPLRASTRYRSGSQWGFVCMKGTLEMSVLRRNGRAAGPGGSLRRVDDNSKMAGKFPGIWEFLTLETWEGGDARETGSVTLFFQDGLLKGCLCDKDADLVAFVAADSLEALLQAIEASLTQEKADWRRQRENGGGRPRKG